MQEKKRMLTDLRNSARAHGGIHFASIGHRTVAFVLTLLTFCGVSKVNAAWDITVYQGTHAPGRRVQNFEQNSSPPGFGGRPRSRTHATTHAHQLWPPWFPGWTGQGGWGATGSGLSHEIHENEERPTHMIDSGDDGRRGASSL